jgi:hypothetical protein
MLQFPETQVFVCDEFVTFVAEWFEAPRDSVLVRTTGAQFALGLFGRNFFWPSAVLTLDFVRTRRISVLCESKS